MAFNNGFPATYQPMYYQQPQNTSIIWVQGEAGAKSYLVAPNTTVQLWDSERQTIYLKSADASGMPSIRTLDYTFREAQPTSPQKAPETYATKSDVELLTSEINALKGEIKAYKEAHHEPAV